jgi:hypothetical protein
MAGLELERLVVAEQQVAHVLYAVNTVIVKELHRVLLRSVAVGRRGV